MAKLTQVLAVEKGIKNKVQGTIDGLYKAVQKPSLFEGFTKTYQKVREDEEQLPAQQQRVQYTVKSVLKEISTQLTDLFTVTAQKDYANTGAKADVEIEGQVILSEVPTTFLLFLEKQLTDLYTVVSKVPTLDLADDWNWDPIKQLWKTEPNITARTKKVPKPVVLYPATPEHPAQTQMLAEDIIVGNYENVKLSGALEDRERKSLLDKIETLQKAVKFAREKANTAEAPKQNIEKVIQFIFS